MGRWLTPEFEPRRYDTFFLARLPSHQRTQDIGGESDHAVWLPMLPPTAQTPHQLSGHADIEAALAASSMRMLTAPVCPRIQVDDDRAWLIMA